MVVRPLASVLTTVTDFSSPDQVIVRPAGMNEHPPGKPFVDVDDSEKLSGKSMLAPLLAAMTLPAQNASASTCWFNLDRLHESLGDLPPAEFEALYALQT